MSSWCDEVMPTMLMIGKCIAVVKMCYICTSCKDVYKRLAILDTRMLFAY